MTLRDLLTQSPTVVIGRVAGVTSEGRPVVDWDGQADGPAPAEAIRTAFEPDWAACRGLRVALALAGGDERRPVVLGLLDPPPPKTPDATAPATDSGAKVLRLSGEEELILECGKAKISLRADGRVVIRGGYVLSHSTGVNKIRGGSVQIN